LIIGAGPAGLAVAGRLRQKNIDFEMLEAGQHAGNAWHGHYDRLHLHTVKELSHLPGLPFPADYPRYVPRHLLVRYFEDYVKAFNIQPHFSQRVVSTRRGTDG
jgi:cation diffusion facilitator CzcD-associated flavoprotein CzcO